MKEVHYDLQSQSTCYTCQTFKARKARKASRHLLPREYKQCRSVKKPYAQVSALTRLTAANPKLLNEIPEEVDILITMGCNVVCPFIPNSHSEDWGLDDPSSGPIDGYRETRDLIREKVEDLINRVKKEVIK